MTTSCRKRYLNSLRVSSTRWGEEFNTMNTKVHVTSVQVHGWLWYPPLGSMYMLNIKFYVSRFQKRGNFNFAQNAKFWHFSSYHHFKAVRVCDVIFDLWAHQAFCFTIPLLKLSITSCQKWWPSNWRYKTADFWAQVVCVLAIPTQEMGRAWSS